MSSVNGAFGFHNRLTLGGIDEVIALAVTMLKLASNGGSGTIKDADGEEVPYMVHPDWPRLARDGKLKLVGRTLDLKSAYRQLA
eukprot:5972284-Amphidinium_carterae.1